MHCVSRSRLCVCVCVPMHCTRKTLCAPLGRRNRRTSEKEVRVVPVRARASQLLRLVQNVVRAGRVRAAPTKLHSEALLSPNCTRVWAFAVRKARRLLAPVGGKGHQRAGKVTARIRSSTFVGVLSHVVAVVLMLFCFRDNFPPSFRTENSTITV